MQRKLIDEFVKCFIDSAHQDGLLESANPLYRAEEIRKQLTDVEYKLAMKESILALLQRNFIVQAIGIIEGPEDFNTKELASDPEVKKLAEQKYREAAEGQLETADDLKKFFRL